LKREFRGLTPRAFAPQAGAAARPARETGPRNSRRPDRSSRLARQATAREEKMAESVYKVIELVGTSTESWEKAAAAAVERASKSVRDLRVAEVVEQDLVIENGKVEAYRTKLKVSFKYEGKDD
jgi:flavin-binding protein dodecin